MFYSKDTKTGQRVSLKTSDAEEARHIVNAKNEAERQPMLKSPARQGLPARQRQRHRQTDMADAIIALTETKLGANQDR